MLSRCAFSETGLTGSLLLMSLEARIKQLCAELLVCRDEKRCEELARELRSTLHDFVEEIRVRHDGMKVATRQAIDRYQRIMDLAANR